MSFPPIRVLVAEDSLTVRHYLAGLIDESPLFQVVGMARDGLEALALAQHLAPDVISMDVNMPIMDGLEATRRIMRANPLPVVIVSSLADQEVELSFRALQAGALAVIPKPPNRTDQGFLAHRQQLWTTLQAMAGVKVVRRWASVYEVQRHEPRNYDTQRVRPKPNLVAVAASAGGPSTIATLLGALGNNVNVPVVIVQHMPAEFMAGLARWLSRFTELPITLATHNSILQPGTVTLAPGDAHLRVTQEEDLLIAQLDPVMGKYLHQPAADVLFESVAQACGVSGIGVILTGMGNDGAQGLLTLRQLNARTFAQEEASCTVFGMPAAAIALGAAERVLSPTQIGTTLRKLV
ncbi:MAG: chemotaxis-specific protein-glutamate methyltransferase CheB [Phototrophicaceae bacterium]|jgi:two-component system chemotaxis response regulator CheB